MNWKKWKEDEVVFLKFNYLKFQIGELEKYLKVDKIVIYLKVKLFGING